MGAEQSTPGEGPTAGAAEETKAEGIEKPKPPTAMSLDQKSTQAVLAGMEGVMARVPAEAISSGATIQDLALNLPTPGHERKRAGLPSMRSFLSWRPGSSDSSQHDGSTARSGSYGRLTDRFFLSKRGTEHNDPKLVFAGLYGSSLHCALNHPRRLKEVLRQGGINPSAKDNDGDRTPLHWAAARGHLQCLHLLIEAGADISAVDASGQTPAQVAEANDQPLARDLLLHGPPKPDPRSMHSGLFALSLHAALNQPTELRKILESGAEYRLKKGAHGPVAFDIDVNRVDADGDRAPLHWAAARGYIKCVQLLLEYGASPGNTDANGKTAAALAYDCNQHAVQELILNYRPPSRDPMDVTDQPDLIA